MSGARTALFASLAVNVLLVGVIVGVGVSEMRHHRDRASREIARAPNMRVLMQSLPPERAAQVRQKVIGAFRDAREERRAARQARLDVARVAGADTYDVAAAKAAFARMRAADARLATHFQDVVAEEMASLSVAERRAMVRQLAMRRGEQGRGDQGRRGLRDADTGEATPETPAQP